MPDFRVDDANQRPFSAVGVDFTGPISREKDTGAKFYVLLFTCARIRAVHLELTRGLDRSSCLNAFRRFAYRRGTPVVIISDNAKTFVAVSQIVAAQHGSEWQFITPTSPWRGGFYERLNRSLKEPLKKWINNQPQTFDALQTIICQVEAIVNSRPLGPITDDPHDMVLTPSHFLIGHSLVCPPKSDIEAGFTDPTSGQFLKLWKGRSDTLKSFWTHWKQHYLRGLRQQNKVTGNCSLQVGDVCLVNNEKDRNCWPLAVVEALHQGTDGRVRTASVRMKGKSLLRPIQRIYLLESVNKKSL